MTLRRIPPIGEVVIYHGPMFAQKSERLIIDLRHRRQYGRQHYQLFHPHTNTRDGPHCKARSGKKELSQEFRTTVELEALINPEIHVIAIDEIQFADPSIIGLIIALRNRGQDVVCAGLDFDFRRIPFPVVAAIINLADDAQRLHAWCTVCGRRARWSQLLAEPPKEGNIVVGHNYAARCENCHVPTP